MDYSGGKWRAAIGGVACLLMVMTALLLWGRLKLVTGVPRTAVAVPEAAQVEPDAGASVEPGER
jgi:hypothetical protein